VPRIDRVPITITDSRTIFAVQTVLIVKLDNLRTMLEYNNVFIEGNQTSVLGKVHQTLKLIAAFKTNDFLKIVVERKPVSISATIRHFTKDCNYSSYY
jgi:hypothetical protein